MADRERGLNQCDTEQLCDGSPAGQVLWLALRVLLVGLPLRLNSLRVCSFFTWCLVCSEGACTLS